MLVVDKERLLRLALASVLALSSSSSLKAAEQEDLFDETPVVENSPNNEAGQSEQSTQGNFSRNKPLTGSTSCRSILQALVPRFSVRTMLIGTTLAGLGLSQGLKQWDQLARSRASNELKNAPYDPTKPADLQRVLGLFKQGGTLPPYANAHPIVVAAGSGDLKAVQAFWRNVPAQRARQKDALMAALSGRQVEVLRFLLEQGLENVTAEEMEHLGHEAVSQRAYLDLLLQHGFDPRAGDSVLLRKAAAAKRLDLVRMLIEKGADVNARGGEALFTSSSDVSELLLKKGVFTPVLSPVFLLNGQPVRKSLSVISSQGKILLEDASRTTKIWDLHSGALKQTLPVSPVSSAFSPDGKTVLIGDVGTLQLWDVESGALKVSFDVRGEQIDSIVFSPDGKTAVSINSSEEAKLWNMETGALEMVLNASNAFSRLATDAVEFSRDGKFLVSGDSSGSIRLWEIRSRSLKKSFDGHSWGTLSVGISSDGKTVLSAGMDGTAKLWDVESGALKATLGKGEQTQENILSGMMASFSPDGKSVVTFRSDETLSLWDSATGNLKASLPGHSSAIDSVSFSPDGKTLMSRDLGDQVILWDARTGDLIARLPRSHRSAFAQFSPDGKWIASANRGGSVEFFPAQYLDVERAKHFLAGLQKEGAVNPITTSLGVDLEWEWRNLVSALKNRSKHRLEEVKSLVEKSVAEPSLRTTLMVLAERLFSAEK